MGRDRRARRYASANDEKGRRRINACTSSSLMPATSVSGIRIEFDPEHVDAVDPSVVEQQPLWIHARIVGEDSGVERRWMVRFQPGGLVGGQRERRGVGLAESEGCEGTQDLPDPIHGRDVVPLVDRGGIEPRPDVVLPFRGAHAAAALVGLGQ